MKRFGVPAAALFLSISLVDAANAGKETQFAGYLLLPTAVSITLSVPVAHTLSLFCHPRVGCPGVAGTLCFMEPEGNGTEPADSQDTAFSNGKKKGSFLGIIPRLLFQDQKRPVAGRHSPGVPSVSFPG